MLGVEQLEARLTPNAAPVAVADTFAVLHDNPLNINTPGILANDSDADQDPLTVELVSGVAHGALYLNQIYDPLTGWSNVPGGFHYVPFAGYVGEDVFAYRLFDGTDYSETVTVTIDVTNHLPEGVNDGVFEVHQGDTLNVMSGVGILSNDSDADGDSLSAILVTNVEHGALYLNQNYDPVTGWSNVPGGFYYVPYAGYAGPDSFTYLVFDGAEYGMNVTVALDVTNQAPVAEDDGVYEVHQGDTLNVLSAESILLNDDDGDEDSLDAVLVTNVAHGSLYLNQNYDPVTGWSNAPGGFYYVPYSGYTGEDSFAYRVFDGAEYSETVTVSLDVTDLAPLAEDDGVYWVEQGQILTVAAEDGVLANDVDEDGDTLTVSLVTFPDHGVVSLNSDGSFAYSPYSSYAGPDAFTYQVNDGALNSDPVTVSLYVGNLGPVAHDDGVFDVIAGTSWVIDVLANDTDSDSSSVEILDATDGPYGTVVVNYADGTVTYTPDEGASGKDTFTYTIQDSQGQIATATVTVNILPLDDLLLVEDDEYTFTEDTTLTVSAALGVLDNDDWSSATTPEVVLIEDVFAGDLTLNADGSFEYVPDEDWDGTDAFTYRILSEDGYSEEVLVLLTGTPVNDAPVAVDDGSEEEPIATFAATPVAIEVVGNDSDAEDRPTLDAFADGTHGTVEEEEDTGRLIYTPNVGYVGLDSFTYAIRDSDGLTSTATVFVEVLPVSSSVVTTADVYELDEDTVLVVEAVDGVLFNDGSVTFEVVLVALPTKGDVTLNADGSFVYRPRPDADGTDSFTYRAYNTTTETYSLPTVVSLDIAPIQDAPVLDLNSPYATEEGVIAVEVVEGDTVTLTPYDLAYDPDLDELEFMPDSLVGGSGMSATADELTFTPDDPGDRTAYILVRDKESLTQRNVRVLFRVLEQLFQPRMDVSGHYDLPLSAYATAAGQPPVPLILKPSDALLGSLTLTGDAAAVASYEDAPIPVAPAITADTVFVLNFKPEKVAFDVTVLMQGVAFDTDNQLGNGNDVFFRFAGTSAAGIDDEVYLKKVQRYDGSYDITIRLGAYYDSDPLLVMPNFTRIAFISRVDVPSDSTKPSATFSNVHQVTELTIPDYLPTLSVNPYTALRGDQEVLTGKVEANLFKEGVARDDYLTRFNAAAASRDSAYRFNLYDPLTPVTSIRLLTLPFKGTLTAPGNPTALTVGASLPQGKFIYTNTAALGESGDFFFYEVEIATPGGSSIKSRQRANIHIGNATRFDITNYVALLGDNPEQLAYLDQSLPPIPTDFHPIQALGGGGGDFRMIVEEFKKNGAKNLVVISYGGDYEGVLSYVKDLAGAVHRPFTSAEAFFLSTEEQASGKQLKDALKRPDTAVFFTGGNQTNYLDLFWGTNRDTSFLNTINDRFGKTLSFGGASAGLAIQGRRAFHGPVNNNTTSRLLLDKHNMYSAGTLRHYVYFIDNFLNLGVGPDRTFVTETHFKERDRMARFVTMIAASQHEIETNQSVQDILPWTGVMYGIAVDEGTALIVDLQTGVGTVRHTSRPWYELPGYVFIGEAKQGTRVTFKAGRLDITESVSIQRLGYGEKFNINTWNVVEAASRAYAVFIENGEAFTLKLSLRGDLYYRLSSLDPRL